MSKIKRSEVTPESWQQMQMVAAASQAGAIAPNSAMGAIMELYQTGNKKAQKEVDEQKNLENFQRNITLGQMYMQMGDPDTGKAYLYQALSPAQKGKIDEAKNWKPSRADKFAGGLVGLKRGGIFGAVKGAKNPLSMGVAMGNSDDDQNWLGAGLDATKWLGKQNLGLGESGDYRFDPSQMRLMDYYLNPDASGGYNAPTQVGNPSAFEYPAF